MDTCVDMCMDTCFDMCVDTCASMCVDTCADVRTDSSGARLDDCDGCDGFGIGGCVCPSSEKHSLDDSNLATRALSCPALMLFLKQMDMLSMMTIVYRIASLLNNNRVNTRVFDAH